MMNIRLEMISDVHFSYWPVKKKKQAQSQKCEDELISWQDHFYF